ncbi:hypothetical protein Lal_00017984 [Lupinus albus]|nr:hypothetical protein Lal_00017984 [Lupinus albus]
MNLELILAHKITAAPFSNQFYLRKFRSDCFLHKLVKLVFQACLSLVAKISNLAWQDFEALLTKIFSLERERARLSENLTLLH